MKLTSSPMRYPGGKNCLTKHFSDLIKLNKLNNVTYVEPFAGGAGAALNLLLLEYVNSIWINDADYNIYCFWYSILNHTEEFVNLVWNTEVNINNWYRLRDIMNSNRKYKMLDIGFATFFLNRCNHSGVLNAGPIGGKKQEGKWKIDARFNKDILIKKILKISYYKERIKVSNEDASDLLKKINHQNYLIYLDPPYFKKGKNLYLNYYEMSDHKVLAKYIKNSLKTNWILSYDNALEIIDLYNDKRHIFFEIKYSINKSKNGNEVIFYSDNLKIPPFSM
jgi:DNA adenine methylase